MGFVAVVKTARLPTGLNFCLPRPAGKSCWNISACPSVEIKDSGQIRQSLKRKGIIDGGRALPLKTNRGWSLVRLNKIEYNQYGVFMTFFFSHGSVHWDTILIQILSWSTWVGGVLKSFENRIYAADLFHMATIATGSEPVQLPSL